MSVLARLVAHNPELLDRDAIVEGFIARRPLLGRVLADLRAERPAHVAIVGARGMGKTTLLRRLRFAIEEEEALAKRWIAVGFREEQYNIQRLSDFWLNCLDSISDALDANGATTEAEALDAEISRIAALAEPDRSDRSLERLRKYASAKKRGLVLLVDNARVLFDRLNSDEQWKLRSLLNEGKFVLVAANETVHSSFYEYGKPFYEFFRIETLESLGPAEMRETLLAIADRRGTPEVTKIVTEDPGRIEALRSLTGGNPRAVVLVHQVLSTRDDERGVSEDLLALLDQVTPYYKARVEALPDQAQAIFDAVALEWKPITAASVASRVRLSSKHASAQLGRMVDDGVLERVPLPRKQTGYQIAERLWNIWYLMRANRRARRKLLWLAEFLREVHGGSYVQKRVDELLARTQRDPFDRDLLLALVSVLVSGDESSRGVEWEAVRALAEDAEDVRKELAAYLDLDGEDAHLKPVADRIAVTREIERHLTDAPAAADGTPAFDRVVSAFMLPMAERAHLAQQIAAGTKSADALPRWPSSFPKELVELSKLGLLPAPEEDADYDPFAKRWPELLRFVLMARVMHLASRAPGVDLEDALGHVLPAVYRRSDFRLWALTLVAIELMAIQPEFFAVLSRADGSHRDPNLMIRLYVDTLGAGSVLAFQLADAAAQSLRLRDPASSDGVAVQAFNAALFGWDAEVWITAATQLEQNPLAPALLLHTGQHEAALRLVQTSFATTRERDVASAAMLALPCLRAALQTGQALPLLTILRELPAMPYREVLVATLEQAVFGSAASVVEAELQGLIERLVRVITMPTPERITYLPVAPVPRVRTKNPRGHRARATIRRAKKRKPR